MVGPFSFTEEHSEYIYRYAQTNLWYDNAKKNHYTKNEFFH